MAAFQYTPIDLDGRAFRLLRVQRGNFGDEIFCELFDAYLGEEEGGIPYESLSYTWGSDKKTHKVFVDGKPLFITENLNTALHYLRKSDEDRIMWIDAICIDQSNVHERGHQVLHMRHIYTQAQSVIFWLGTATPETDTAMDLMKYLQKKMFETTDDWLSVADIYYTCWRKMNMGTDGILPTHIYQSAFQKLLDRPWFDRIWILQEAASAKSAVVTCGSKSVTARIFTATLRMLKVQPSKHCQSVIDIMPGIYRKGSWWSRDRRLFTLLRKFQRCHATDPRDRIFALLGISSDAINSPMLLPDYKKDLKQVLSDAVVFLLAEHDIYFCDISPVSVQEFSQFFQSLHLLMLEKNISVGKIESSNILISQKEVGFAPENIKKWMHLLLEAELRSHSILIELLELRRLDLNAKDETGKTALIHAVHAGNIKLVELLLKYYQEHFAYRSSILLEWLNTEDQEGKTAFLHAVVNGQAGIVALLLPYLTDSLDLRHTALAFASANGHTDIVGLILDHVYTHNANWDTMAKLYEYESLIWLSNSRLRQATPA